MPTVLENLTIDERVSLKSLVQTRRQLFELNMEADEEKYESVHASQAYGFEATLLKVLIVTSLSNATPTVAKLYSNFNSLYIVLEQQIIEMKYTFSSSEPGKRQKLSRIRSRVSSIKTQINLYLEFLGEQLLV